MILSMAEKTLTPRQFAELHAVGYTTVMRWIKRNLIPSKREPLPYKGYIYQISANAKPPDLKPGPKPKEEEKVKKGAKKKAKSNGKVN